MSHSFDATLKDMLAPDPADFVPVFGLARIEPAVALNVDLSTISAATDVAIGFGIAIHYSIMLNLAAVSFWIVRAQGLVYGYFNFLNIARYPHVIYPRLFRLIFSWIIPVVIVANIPARILIKSLGQPLPLMLQMIAASLIIFWSSRVFWRFALRRYSSASS